MSTRQEKKFRTYSAQSRQLSVEPAPGSQFEIESILPTVA
jgi:hypothetical protein